jgi:hypothetical protein
MTLSPFVSSMDVDVDSGRSERWPAQVLAHQFLSKLVFEGTRRVLRGEP